MLYKYSAKSGQQNKKHMQNIKNIWRFSILRRENMEYRDLTFEELKKDFKLVKRKKSAVHDDIDSNVIIKAYDEISYPLFMPSHSSFNEGIFLEQLKIAKASQFFKIGNIEKYRLSFPRTFSKIS